MEYRRRREWSDTFIPEIKSIVGPYLLVPSSLKLDTEEATDLLVFKARDMRIAARMRDTKNGYIDDYPFDFTIRYKLDSGTVTELKKIISGWGDWLFYGHGGDDFKISRWMIVDLSAFREALILRLPITFRKKSNGDGTHFVAYDVRSFSGTSSPILIASSFAGELNRGRAYG